MTAVTDSPKVTSYFKKFKTSQQLRPCYQAIDMRGRVSEPCGRYLFNDRIHYLDDRSLVMYQEGVKRNRGVLTMQTFESVINAPHTLNQAGMNDARVPAANNDAIEELQQEAEPEENYPVELNATITDPEIISFGYFKERREPRLQIICEAEALLYGARIKGVTRDLSVSGIKFFIEGSHSVRTGDEIFISFMGIQREAEGIDVYDIPYAVVAFDYQDEGVLLGLQRTNPGKQTQFDKCIASLLKRRDPDHKLDIEDDCQSAQAWYFERLYAENSAFIPFFISKDETDNLLVQSVALTKGNQYLSRFFCTNTDNYNFTPLCLPLRLQVLQGQKNLLIAMYRDQGDSDRSQRIHSAACSEFSTHEEFLGFVKHALSFPEHCVIKVMPGSMPVKPVSTAKTALFSSKLRSLSSERAGQLEEQIAALQFVAYIADMTGWAQQCVEETSEQLKSDARVWVGSEHRIIETGEVSDKLEMSWRNLNPDLIRFGYAERRREHRYLAKTTVSVQLREETVEGMTQDLSWHGLRVLLPGKTNVKQGAMIKVGLTTMQEKRHKIDLMNIPYRIVQHFFKDEATVLMLERISGNRDSVTDEFFAELIMKNRHKMPVDTSDVVNAATASIFEAMQSNNTAAMAFFLSMDRKSGVSLQYLGLPAGGNVLAQNISRGDGNKFGYLFSQKLVKAMYDAVQLQARQPGADQGVRPAFEFDMFVYQDGSTTEDEFSVVSEFDSADTDEWKATCQSIMAGKEWRGLHVVVSPAHAIEDKLFDTLLAGIRKESKHRAIKLSDAVVSIAGCGEIFDITDELAKMSG